MSELRQLFFETAAELVQKLNDEAMQLEKAPGDAATARSLRRTVHTLKGDSAACGFRELSELCHEFEDVLTLENSAAAASVPEIALRAADVFAALLEAYRNGTKLPSIQSLRADIVRLAHPAPGGAGKATQKKRKAAAKTSRWSEYEQLAMARAVAMGKRVHHVVVEIDPQCAMPIAGRQMIQLALAELGEVLALYPAEDSLDPIKQIEAALVSEKPVERIRAKCSIPTIALNVKVKPLRVKAPLPPLAQAAAASAGSTAEGANEAGLPAQATAAAGDARFPVHNANDVPAAAEAAPAPGVASGPDNLLRVDAEKIDSVLNLVGELILAKSMLQQALLEFGGRFPKDELRGRFADAMVFQGRVLNDLQHAVMKIRMVPVDQLFRRFPRIVRDVGLQCGKEVELLIEGGQTDLDKSILDAIAEPMTHLVRNAIGHGI
ncbi:MAG TPA: Hpt domain-containing protein, partial [Candidatus Acidoferrales bacterium]|nr:Hpt domain-containing protein [Candidatus Acidoferrales bacterium]